MKENEHIWMHMSCAELARLLYGLWARYYPLTEFRLPATYRFINNIGDPASLRRAHVPLADVGAAEALSELSRFGDFSGLNYDDVEQLKFVIEVTKGGIEAEAAYRAKQVEPRTPLETLPEEPSP